MVEEEKIKVDRKTTTRTTTTMRKRTGILIRTRAKLLLPGRASWKTTATTRRGKTKNNKLKHHNYDTLTYDHDHLKYTKAWMQNSAKGRGYAHAGGKIATAMVHKQGADAVCPMPMSCADPDLKSNALHKPASVVVGHE